LPSPLAALLLQQSPINGELSGIWDLISKGSWLADVVLFILGLFSIFSWTIIFSKWSTLGGARKTDARFLRAFRKANGIEAVMVASEQYRPSPLVAVFDHGYEEVARQVKSRGSLANRDSITRCLQIGANQQLSLLEQNLGWLATTASVSPFIGLFGTVVGIIRAFQTLQGGSGGASLSSVGPGIAEALTATAAGPFAAIPAAMFYNHFGHLLKEIGSAMDDFSLEFLNLIERSFGD
jgi:biopolymer transport protein TolQ